jgi:hypothetical protein
VGQFAAGDLWVFGGRYRRQEEPHVCAAALCGRSTSFALLLLLYRDKTLYLCIAVCHCGLSIGCVAHASKCRISGCDGEGSKRSCRHKNLRLALAIAHVSTKALGTHVACWDGSTSTVCDVVFWIGSEDCMFGGNTVVHRGSNRGTFCLSSFHVIRKPLSPEKFENFEKDVDRRHRCRSAVCTVPNIEAECLA